VTSEEDEEWDYLKGIDITTMKTTKKDLSYKLFQKKIIDGDKLASKIMEDKLRPKPDFINDKYANHKKFMENFNYKYKKNSHMV